VVQLGYDYEQDTQEKPKKDRPCVREVLERGR